MPASKKANQPKPDGIEVHKIEEVKQEVNASHPGLGNLAAISMIAAKARQTLMVIGPPGTGKSAVAHWLEGALPEAYVRGDLTMAGLRKYCEELSDSEAAIVIDDLGECNSEWNRAQTCIAISALVYGHNMVKDTHQIKVEILDYYGSGWIGLQPAILAEVVKHPSFHANLRDKSLRYYHLQRPVVANFGPIEVQPSWGLEFNDVVPIEAYSDDYETLMQIARIEWSNARAQEHVGSLLRAAAALDNRYAVDQSDYDLLLSLVKPMTIEEHLIEKQGFDSAASLNQNLLCLLAEFASYPEVTYEIIGSDYGIRPRKVQSILEDMHEWYYKVGQDPVTLKATENLEALLVEAGLR